MMYLRGYILFLGSGEGVRRLGTLPMSISVAWDTQRLPRGINMENPDSWNASALESSGLILRESPNSRHRTHNTLISVAKRHIRSV